MHVRKHGGKIIQAAFILAMAMMAVPFSSVAATTSYEKTVTNSIELGAVDISLSEYETDEDGKEASAEVARAACAPPSETPGVRRSPRRCCARARRFVRSPRVA